jgi:epsin
MDLIWNSLDTDGRSWKQLYKSLTLIDFLIKQGSERVVEDTRDHLRLIRPLTNYNFWEEGTDKGAGVCDKAKQIIELLNDNARIRTEREKCSKLRNKLVGISNDGNRSSMSGGGGGYGGSGGGYGNSGIGSDYRGGGSGGGGYGNSGIGSDYNRNGDSDRGGGRSAYGGGTYDSNNPNRFSDDSNSNNDNTGVVNKTYDSSANNRNTWSDSEPTKSSGKLRVAIKPTDRASSPQASAPAAEVDFFANDDFQSAPTAPSAPAFDPFGENTAAAPAPAAPSFDPFGAAPPVPAHPTAQAAFDPFGSAPAPPAVPTQQANADPFGMGGMHGGMNGGNMGMNGGSMGMNGGSMGNNMSNNMGMNGGSMGMNGGSMGNNMSNNMGGGVQNYGIGGMNKTTPTFNSRNAPAPAVNADDEDFGGFEAAPSAPVASTAAKSKGAFGGLVDMDNFKISANAAPAAAKKPVAGMSTTSFNGIDGFNGVSLGASCYIV